MDEAERVRTAYARRARLGLDARYAYWEPANLFIYQTRERALLRELHAANMLPLAGRRVLDVGCGDGEVLRDLLRYGAHPHDLYGIDLLPDRVDRARELTPGACIETGDARSLPYEDASFDLVLAFTLLSSVVEPAARKQVATEMRRVVRKDGLILVYDFWTNPLNRDVRPVRRAELPRLFAGARFNFTATTVAPPLVRALVKAPGGWLACSCLDVLPFVKTHYLAGIRV
jgi:ubiquinone/menaquinone biosynthesis C-methylase UbiE